MAEPFFGNLRRKMGRILRILFALDPGPANLAESVADRLFAELKPGERARLRQRFGVDSDTNAELENIAARFRITRKRIREVEGPALIRLYRWEARKSRLPAVQRRLVRRIADAHETILEALCGAPPVRPVLVGWHDQLVDGRRQAGEIAAPPDPVIADDPEAAAATTPELVLAAKLRKALWAHTRGRKAARAQDEARAGRDGKQAKTLELMLAARFNAQSIRAMADSLLRHARRMAVASDEMTPQPLDPAEDRDGAVPPGAPSGSATPWRDELPDILERDPALADAIVEESGMFVDELWEQAVKAGNAVAKAEHNLRLLTNAGMPMVAEIAVGQGLRGKAFFAGVERAHAALLRLADRSCFTGAEDFTTAAERAIRRALGEAADGS